MSRPYKARTLTGAERLVRKLEQQLQERDWLIRRLYDRIDELKGEEKEQPAFFDPTESEETKMVRDILRSSGMNPDGTLIGDGVLAELLKPQHAEFWGKAYDFTPALLNKVYGDGQQILQLFPINERPRYWIVLVDSKCASDDELYEILDDIYEEIDDQFGAPSEEDLGVGDERPYFPMHDGQGVGWHFVRR